MSDGKQVIGHHKYPCTLDSDLIQYAAGKSIARLHVLQLEIASTLYKIAVHGSIVLVGIQVEAAVGIYNAQPGLGGQLVAAKVRVAENLAGSIAVGKRILLIRLHTIEKLHTGDPIE